MKCNKIEKLIMLSDIQKLSEKESREISDHIAFCTECNEKAQQMSEYQTYIHELKNSEPVLTSPEDLTQSILDKAFSETNPRKTFLSKSLNMGFRHYRQIAASILLIIISGYYLQQKISVNNALADLNKTYHEAAGNTVLTQDFNECKDYAEARLKQLLETDKDFAEILSKLNPESTEYKLQKYTSGICLYTYENFDKAKPEQQKQIILKFLRTNLNPIQ
jgi:hypothetical protein